MAKVLEAHAESGLTLSAFAAREGVDVYRLYRWRRLSASAPTLATFEEIVAGKTSPSLSEAALPADARIEIVFPSGRVARVPEAFNPRRREGGALSRGDAEVRWDPFGCTVGLGSRGPAGGTALSNHVDPGDS